MLPKTLSNFTPLVNSFKHLFATGIDFIKALVEVFIQLLQLILEVIKGGLSLFH